MRWSLCLRRQQHHRPANNEQNVRVSHEGKRESRQARQQFSHRGDGKISRSLWHVPPVVDRSCASVSRGKHVSNFPIGAMGDLQARLARTHSAVLPLMVDDEMVTVPLWTKTPPPCKHKCKTYENPIGAMGTFEGLCVTHPLGLIRALAAVVQA